MDLSQGSYGNSFSITNNSDSSPLTFVDNVEIKEIKFIPGTKNIYYKIYNKDKGTYYYGLIDVKKNQVIYNLEGDENTIFIPDTTGNMLAITSNKMYRVCMSKDSTTGKCVSETDCTNLLLDPDGNKCQDNCDSGKIKMMPEGICITSDKCDLNIYVLNSAQTECGLCSYFYPNGAKYKIINTQECLSYIPNNTVYYNQQWNLLKCKDNYTLDNNKCVPDYCYEACLTCDEVSNNITDQKCTSCKSGYKLENGNCIIPPTTIVTQAPTTIIQKIPSTSPQTPTTIITTIPKITSTSPKIQTTIITTVPKIPSTSPKIPTTIITTIPKIPSTSPKIPTTIITTVPKIQTTLITTVPTTIPEVKCAEKCLTCNEASNKLGLCLTCNEAKGYKKLNYTITLTQFLNCIKKEDPKFKNYYFNDTLQEYRPCYKTCKRCSRGGNPEAHHCLECETGYMFRPFNNPYNNCVVYSEYYYISSYNQYKSLDIYQCPEEAIYYIKEKKSCIDDCKKDSIYKYLYNGNCLKECPTGTHSVNYVCIINNRDKCILGKNDIYLAKKDKLEVIGTLVKSYISEFDYTERYVSLYQNKNYTIIIYKDQNCISELSLEFPDVDFQSCYTKVQQEYNINQNLIIVIVDKRGVKIPSTFYSFYHPLSGFKLDAENICKNETIVVVESLTSVLDKNDTRYETQTSLTSQGINIFDLNDPFYTDICYDFDNPLKKDIPLNDRIKDLYPNVSLCDEGCQYKGINLEDMTSTCDCNFNDITNNNLVKDNELINEAFGEIFDLINSSNILVFKCFKYIFKHFSRSIGAWLSLSLIGVHIAMTLFYFLTESIKIAKYVFTLTKNYISYISNKGRKKGPNPPKRGISNQAKSEMVNSETKLKSKKKNLKPITKSKFNKDDFIIPFQGNINLKSQKKEKSEYDKSEKISKKLNKMNKIDTEDNLVRSSTNGDNISEYDKNFFKEYLATDFDDMEFDDAVAKDKRKYCEHMKENLIED